MKDRKLRIKFLGPFFVIFLTFMFSGIALGKFPEKPIVIIVAAAPGSAHDFAIRGLIPYIEKNLGTRIIVENIPGANYRVGLNKLWKAKPDGEKLGVISLPAQVIGEKIFNAEYSISKFTPIFAWVKDNQAVFVNPNKYNNWDELLVKGKKEGLSCAIALVGSSSHFLGLQVFKELGVNVRWIPFSGGGQALAATAGGHVDFSMINATLGLPLVQAGKLRALLIFADAKDENYPEVTISKQILPNLHLQPNIIGVVGPPKIPPEIVQVLVNAFKSAVHEKTYVEWAKKRNVNLISVEGKAFSNQIKALYPLIEEFQGLLNAEK